MQANAIINGSRAISIIFGLYLRRTLVGFGYIMIYNLKCWDYGEFEVTVSCNSNCSQK